jgi:hypothetical protein
MRYRDSRGRFIRWKPIFILCAECGERGPQAIDPRNGQLVTEEEPSPMCQDCFNDLMSEILNPDPVDWTRGGSPIYAEDLL